MIFRSQNNTSLAGIVGAENAFTAVNHTACRKIWSGNVGHELTAGNVRVVNHGKNAVDNLGKIMCRNVGCKTYCNT